MANCKTSGCFFSGFPIYGGYCSGCFSRATLTPEEQEQVDKARAQIGIKKEFVKNLTEAIPLGVQAVEAVLANKAAYPAKSEIGGCVGEGFEKAIEEANLDVCKLLAERFKDNPDVFVRRYMEDFLNRVRDNLFRRGVPLRDEFFDFLATLPNQVNSSSVSCAKMMHNGKTFVRKLEALERQNVKHAREAEAEKAGEAGKEEEEEDDAKLTSELFLAPEFSDLLDSKKLLIWSDGEVTADTEEEKTRKTTLTLSDTLQKISEACKKMDKEFDKDEWEQNTGAEVWRGFFVHCPESEAGEVDAGEAMARKVLQVQDVADKMEVRKKEMPDSRQTLFPQRYYYAGHVSKSGLARVKRASNLIKAPAKKNSLVEVKFYTEERAWYWPPIILVGRSKADSNYLVGLRIVTHDQEHLHHGQ